MIKPILQQIDNTYLENVYTGVGYSTLLPLFSGMNLLPIRLCEYMFTCQIAAIFI